jgi:hypothetical protein
MVVALIAVAAFLHVAIDIKIRAESPRGDRVVVIGQIAGEPDTAYILHKNSGKTLKHFRLLADHPEAIGECKSIEDVAWPRPDTITAECSLFDHMTVYVEVDAKTLKTRRAMLHAGPVFPSPDHSKVASFLPGLTRRQDPTQESSYIIVDNADLYPLPPNPPGNRVEPLTPLRVFTKYESSYLATTTDNMVFHGVHEIGQLAWSPDSELLAFIEKDVRCEILRRGTLRLGHR